MIVAYLLVLAGITCVSMAAVTGLWLVSFIGGGLLVAAVRVAYEVGRSERR